MLKIPTILSTLVSRNNTNFRSADGTMKLKTYWNQSQNTHSRILFSILLLVSIVFFFSLKRISANFSTCTFEQSVRKACVCVCVVWYMWLWIAQWRASHLKMTIALESNLYPNTRLKPSIPYTISVSLRWKVTTWSGRLSSGISFIFIYWLLIYSVERAAKMRYAFCLIAVHFITSIRALPHNRRCAILPPPNGCMNGVWILDLFEEEWHDIFNTYIHM